MNDNQLMPGGDQGMTLGAQVLGLLLATNRTVNVGLPTVSLLLEGRQHPGLEMGGKGGLRKPQAHPTPSFTQRSSWCRGKIQSTLGIPDPHRAPPNLRPPVYPWDSRPLEGSTQPQASESIVSSDEEEGGTEDQQRWVVRGLSASPRKEPGQRKPMCRPQLKPVL